MTGKELIKFIKAHNKRYEKEDLSKYSILQLKGIKAIIDMKQAIHEGNKKIKAKKK